MSPQSQSTQGETTTAELSPLPYCYFCFQPADKRIGKYDLCRPCHYKFEDAIDNLVLEILERGAFREILSHTAIAEAEGDADVADLLAEAGAAKRAEGERRMAVTRESLLETLGRISDLTVPDPGTVSDRATLDQIRKMAERVLMRAALQEVRSRGYDVGIREGHSMGCNDDSCSCWAAGYEEGLEAQREPAGGGRA